MHSTELVLADTDHGAFAPYGIFFGGLLCLHGIALVLNVRNYAAWWQLIQEQYRAQHISQRGWHRIGWLSILIGGPLLIAGLVQLAT